MDFNLNQTIEILQRTPNVIRTMLQGLANEWLLSDYGENTWSVHQIIGHLIWGERTDWIPRTKQILTQEEVIPFEPFDRSGHTLLCQESTTAELIDIFEQERQENLRELQGLKLTSIDFDKPGIHPAFGDVTLRQMLASWTVHDLNHLAQINKAMAFQYQQSVGPWEQYISILSPPNPR